MNVSLSKEFRFEAAHRLPRVPDGHKCSRLHGHSYRVTIRVAGEVDPEKGWLMDYADLSGVVTPLISGELDHRYLNEIPGLDNPTSENLAHWLWSRLEHRLDGLEEIRVAETCTDCCIYRG